MNQSSPLDYIDEKVCCSSDVSWTFMTETLCLGKKDLKQWHESEFERRCWNENHKNHGSHLYSETIK